MGALTIKGEIKRHKNDTNNFTDNGTLPIGSEKKKMSDLITLSKPPITYLPAVVKYGTRTYIEYYVWNPNKANSTKLDRKQVRIEKLLKRYSKAAEKKKAANEICVQINEKLKLGWNPYLKKLLPNSFKSINEALQIFYIKKGYGKREETTKNYYYLFNTFKKWLGERANEPIIKFTSIDAINYIDHVYIERKNSLRTRKNHLDLFTSVFRYFEKNGFVEENPFSQVDRLWSKKEVRFRKPIAKNDWPRIIEYFEKVKPGFILALNYLFLSMVRRAEMTKLKLDSIDWNNQTIFIPKEISKTNYDRFATIPNDFFKLLKSLDIHKLPTSYYLIGSPTFYPGEKQVSPKRIDKTWSYMREKLSIPKNNSFYSLRSTGVIEYLEKGVNSKSMVDLADWHSYDVVRLYDRHIKNKAIAEIKEKGQLFG